MFRRLEGLLELEAKHKTAIAKLETDFLEIDRRLTRLESREELVVIEARSAARAGAADAMQGVILQIGERLAAVEAKAQPRQIRRKPEADEQ